MKNTIITFASIVVLGGSANAQTTLVDWTRVNDNTATATLASGTIATLTTAGSAGAQFYSIIPEIANQFINASAYNVGSGEYLANNSSLGGWDAANPDTFTISFSQPEIVEVYLGNFHNAHDISGSWDTVLLDDMTFVGGNLAYDGVDDFVGGQAVGGGILRSTTAISSFTITKGTIEQIDISLSAVPEPSSTALLGLGALGLLARRKR